MHKPGFVYALLAAFHSIHATPMDPLSQLKCDCVSFSSGDATPCSMPDTRNLDWLSAQHIASVHELPIQFASSQVVSSILDANTPLPTSLLLRMIDGTPVPPQVTPSKYSTDWIICGIDETDDMDRRLNGDEDAHTYDVFVLQVIIAVILIVIIYEAGDVFVRRKCPRTTEPSNSPEKRSH
ncbi:hypothetical protein EJ04DRAFT_4591 [Polyplosphaeria fusca]|uniref:Uncharacterized protein n=1 Tax=Polyplosphaeria fusca TaxID=682080 RepID=A0A9P4V9H9_9PLEO|nr:hypothetical protein EJ04DRAFT_4591 [Polyplosphaeria fusca]